MRWRTLLALIFIVFVYLLLGAAMFMVLERDNETEVSKEAYSTFSAFTAANPCVTDDELSSFAKSVISAYDSGVVSTSETSSESNWSFAASLFFSVTVITSIGYGHISPTTSGGQVFFIFYAIIGIPLCATMLVGIGDKLAKPYRKLEKKRFSKHRKTEKLVKMIIVNAVAFGIFSLVPAAIFMTIEGWSYLRAWYYTIVTLTTVGFGDYVPGQQSSDNRALYKIITMIWLFCGLAWLAMLLNIAGDYVKSFSAKVDAGPKKLGKKKIERGNTKADLKYAERQEMRA